MRILVTCAHCDDEILGCGGTMAKHILNGDEVLCFIMNHWNLRSGNMGDYAMKVSEVIGHKLELADSFLDNQFDAKPLLKVIQKMERMVGDYDPDLIYTHYEKDLNIDHRIIFQATLTAFRGETNILSYETPSTIDWTSQMMQPNYFVDITDTIDKKLKAMREYITEYQEYPKARSLEALEALAKMRGVQAGVRYAEAFKVIRLVR